MNLIVPAAGKSSRFPGMRPKWLLTHPEGNIMAVQSILGLNTDDVDNIYLVVLKSHVEKYRCREGISRAFAEVGLLKKLQLVVLDEETRNQPETVYRAIKKCQIEGPIFIKDTDNFFRCRMVPGNSVATFDINDMDLVHASNKSFVTTDEKGSISNIVEKQVISSEFCVGGYSFADAQDFTEHFEGLSTKESLYISHIIFDMMLAKKEFKTNAVEDYIDWGTLKEWNGFKSSYATIFIDLDGVLVRNSSAHFEPIWGTTEAIEDNVKIINNLYDTGKVKIIITTSRSSNFKDATLQQLKGLGIQYHQIIFDLLHGKRIVVNDYARSNPYKSCDSINISRDSSDLRSMIEDSLGMKV